MADHSRRSAVALVGAMILAIAALPASAAGAEPPALRADLEGRPIEPTEASAYFCHDFAYPLVHCFRTSEALEQAVTDALAPLSATAVLSSYGPNDYVTIYSGASYSGSYAHLAQNYDALAWIGWNDITSSYKARNSRTGVFREHWFAGGASTSFCCNQNIPSLPAAKDNTFSSVYQT